MRLANNIELHATLDNQTPNDHESPQINVRSETKLVQYESFKIKNL